MKILIILTCVLVIGILSSEAVAVRIRREERIIHGYREWFAYAQFAYGYGTLKNATLDKCMRYGGSTAHDNAIEGFNQFRNSVYSILNETEQVYILSKSRSLSVVEQVTEVCRSSRKVKNAGKLAVESIKPCFNSDERHTIDVAINVTDVLMEYVCENNGSRISSLYETRGVECIGNYSRRLDACVIGNNTQPRRRPTPESQLTIDIPTFEPNLETCTIGKSKQQCIANVLAGCENKTAPNFIDSVLNILMKEVGCEEILNNQPSTSVDQSSGGKA